MSFSFIHYSYQLRLLPEWHTMLHAQLPLPYPPTKPKFRHQAAIQTQISSKMFNLLLVRHSIRLLIPSPSSPTNAVTCLSLPSPGQPALLMILQSGNFCPITSNKCTVFQHTLYFSSYFRLIVAYYITE